MKLFKTIISQLLFICVNSQKCFVKNDVVNSNKLFTYQGNVYDITGYNHPGGQVDLEKTLGNALEDFVNLPEYDFHLNDNKFKKDLNNMLVGILNDTCTTDPPTTDPPITDPTITDPPTTDPPTISTISTISTTSTTSTTMNQTTDPVTTPSVTDPNTLPNCINLNLNLSIPYYQQNLIGQNKNNIFQDSNGLKLSLIENIGGTRILTTNFIQYGEFDITMKTPKGLNVITSFYIEKINGYIINFNIINKDNITSIIDTNVYNSKTGDVDINYIKYPQPTILTETFNKYSLIWTPDYYEWRVNDIPIRRFIQNETYIFPDFQGKISISLWEAPISEWAGPGINWLSAPFDLFISKFDIECCNNINNSLKIYNSPDDKNDNMANESYLISFNYILIINAIFVAYVMAN